MRPVCGFLLSISCLNQLACGGSQAQRALTAAAAFTAVELAASAIQAESERASARDAAKASHRARGSSSDWRLVRSDDPCNEPISEAQREDCEADDTEQAAVETEEPGISLGQCMVCE
jgi:hypothetical protein